MSVGAAALITRCPECATAFRATPDQLAVRDGKVRCGHCGMVFDARAHEVPATPTAREKVAAAPAPTAPPEAGDADGMAPDNPTLVLTHAPAEDVVRRADDPAPEAERSVTSTANLAFDFGRPQRSASRISPWLAWPALVLLLLILGAQVAYQFRGDIVLLYPQAKPLAQRLCAELGCVLPLPRRVDLLSIESSDLQADSVNPKIMVLSATLRNRAAFAQTPPALELTLTDTQDQPVARRILTAGDYAGGGADNLFAAGSEIPVKVFFEASAVKATGYRLYLFYP